VRLGSYASLLNKLHHGYLTVLTNIQAALSELRNHRCEVGPDFRQRAPRTWRCRPVDDGGGERVCRRQFKAGYIQRAEPGHPMNTVRGA
jgi:hypothetical protein